jgi:hypothetical protein
VISALGRYATPIPMKDVVENDIKVDAVMIYEQWGWPITKLAWEQLAYRYREAIIIRDRVDSADFWLDKADYTNPFDKLVEVGSLSKTLGVPGGGVCLEKSKTLEFIPVPRSQVTDFLLRNGMVDSLAVSGEWDDYFRNNGEVVNPGVAAWMEQNCLQCAMEEERLARQQNLRVLLSSNFSSGWPLWIAEAIESGAGPGLAPVLRGNGEMKLRDVKSRLLTDFGFESEIYHFNWSGNPLEPLYEPCLAFPVHGMVQDLHLILDLVNSWNVNRCL